MTPALRARSTRTQQSARDGAPLAPQAARAMVLDGIGLLVEAGIAILDERDDSSRELRFHSGEVWRLDENWITRER